jgi:hypothetical protein
MNRAKRRAETRKHQREARQHFHPRGLARAVAHSMLAREGATGVNHVEPGVTQSQFSQVWRRVAERFAVDRG